MRSRIHLLPSLLILLLISACGDDSAYIAQIETEIENRIKYLRFNEESPFLQFGKEYSEPAYYPIDANFRVNARVERLEERTYLTLGNSDGSSDRYLKYAWLHFSISGEDQKLLVLKPIGMGSLNRFYLAFADDTSGDETYGGGRYLDVNIGKSDKVILDFNLAYNPYCAYVDEFSCPLPPTENLLTVPITAGEKDFSK